MYSVLIETTEEQKRFVERVASLPYVHDSFVYANETRLGRFANSTLTNLAQNQSVQTAYNNYLQRHVERADALGCRSLDLIEEKLPVLTNVVESRSGHVRAIVTDRRAKLAESLDLLQNTLRQYATAAYNLKDKDHQQVAQHWFQEVASQINNQLASVVTYLKDQPNIPDWVKGRVLSLVDIASKQYELVREQYNRKDISNIEKARVVAQGVQEQVLPVLQTVHSQLLYYTSAKAETLRSYVKLPAVVASH